MTAGTLALAVFIGWVVLAMYGTPLHAPASEVQARLGAAQETQRMAGRMPPPPGQR